MPRGTASPQLRRQGRRANTLPRGEERRFLLALVWEGLVPAGASGSPAVLLLLLMTGAGQRRQAMAPHSVLAVRIQLTEEPVGLGPWGR